MKFKILDGKELEIYSCGPNVRLWIRGPKGGHYAACTFDSSDVDKLVGTLLAHKDLTEAP